MQRSFYKVKKECSFFFSIYIYLYISIYKYIEKRTERSALQKNETFSRSFPFFIKERNNRNVLYVLSRSFEKNGKECFVLLGLISCQNLKKKNGKERNVLNGKERGAKPCVFGASLPDDFPPVV